MDAWMQPYRKMWKDSLNDLGKHLEEMPGLTSHMPQMKEGTPMYADLEPLAGQKSWRLRFTRIFPHPQEKVWRAITEPEHLAAWFPTTVDGERKAGARLIAFDWGGDVVRIELEAVGTCGIRKALRAESRDNRPSGQDIPRPRRAWRISIISLSEPGHRLAHSMASSRDFTWIIQ